MMGLNGWRIHRNIMVIFMGCVSHNIQQHDRGAQDFCVYPRLAMYGHVHRKKYQRLAQVFVNPRIIQTMANSSG